MNNILSVNPGEYVKGTVVANVERAKAITTKTGKTIFKATLRDGANTVEATSFSKTFEHVDGKRVEFSGQGIKRGDDYNGKVSVVFGDKVRFNPVSDATPSQTAPVAEEPHKTQATAANGPSRIEGVTVGMAINKAVDILIDCPGRVTAEELWETASMIIRVAQKLQEGHLAPVTATNEVPSQQDPF